MDYLTVQDDDGDELTIGCREANDRNAVMIKTPSMGVDVDEDGARAIVDWLTEQFGLTRELTAQAIGMDPGLEINVETETGKTRTVRWYGPDVPDELVRLSEVALRVYDRGADASDCKHLTTMRAIYHMVSRLGLREQVGAYDAVEALVDAYRTLRREYAAACQTPPAELAILRQIMARLGLERVDAIPARIDKLVAEINGVAAALASATGTTIGPDGVDLVALVRKIGQQHATAIDRLKLAKHEETERGYADLRTRQESKLSRERDARAEVQVELDRVNGLLAVARAALHETHGLALSDDWTIKDFERVAGEALKASNSDA